MSDVILYAAIKENERLQRELLELCSGGGGGGLSFYETPQGTGYPYTSSTGGAANNLCPQIVLDWEKSLKPKVDVSQSNGFKVCDTSGYYRCNRNCTWTVPSGVSRVQFQLWGPGGGTSNNCCCGGAPFGPSGAYMVVQMDVSSGETYCLCSGCAYCCCGEQTTPGICGSPTWVRGPGICVCANSGQSCYCYWNADIESGTCGCAIPDPGGNCGPHGCSGWNFCWDSGNDDTHVCHAFSRATWVVNCKDDSRNVVCYGINGLYPYQYVPRDNLNGACAISTPVFGFENCVCTDQWNDVTCHGHCRQAQNGFMQIPGAGGYSSRMHGGCRACGGDHGRMGMVCVSWECG